MKIASQFKIIQNGKVCQIHMLEGDVGFVKSFSVECHLDFFQDIGINDSKIGARNILLDTNTYGLNKQSDVIYWRHL